MSLPRIDDLDESIFNFYEDQGFNFTTFDVKELLRKVALEHQKNKKNKTNKRKYQQQMVDLGYALIRNGMIREYRSKWDLDPHYSEYSQLKDKKEDYQLLCFTLKDLHHKAFL